MSAGCVDILWPRSTLKLASVDWVLGTKGRSCTDVCQERSLLCSESGLAGLTTETVWKRFETAVGKPCAQKKSSCTSGSNCEEWGAPYIHASHVSGPVKPECQFGTAPAVAPCRKVHTPRLRLTPLVHTIPPPYTHTHHTPPSLHHRHRCSLCSGFRFPMHVPSSSTARCSDACHLLQVPGDVNHRRLCPCKGPWIPACMHSCMYASIHTSIHT